MPLTEFFAGFFSNFWNSLLYIFFEMSSYVLLGLFIAGLLKVFVPDKWVVRAAGSRGIEVPPLMSLAGVPLPLCSCSVLPFAMGLRKQGASPGAVVSFLTSTPQTGVDSILVAYSFFGFPFALFKTAVAFVSGTLAGWFSNWFGGSGDAVEGRSVESAEVCTEGECCSGSASCDASEGPASRSRLVEAGAYAYGELLGDFASVFLVGIVGSAIVTALLAGFLFDRLFTLDLSAPEAETGGFELPLPVQASASVVLAGLLLFHVGLRLVRQGGKST